MAHKADMGRIGLLAAMTALFALLIAFLSFVVDARTMARERVLIAALAKRPLSSRPPVSSPGGTMRVYRIEGEPFFGSLVEIRAPQGSAFIAALFSASGEPQEIRLVDTSPALLPFDEARLFRDLVGKKSGRAVGSAESWIPRAAQKAFSEAAGTIRGAAAGGL